MKINSIKINKLKIIALILSFGTAFNISSMEETEKVREKKEVQEKRKNVFEDEQELSRAKSVKFDDEQSDFKKLPAEMKTIIAKFVAGSVKDKEEVKKTIKKISSFAQANLELSEIIKDDKFQEYLLNFVHKNFPELSELEVKILIGNPYWAKRLKEAAEKSKALEEKLRFELERAVYDRNIDKVEFLLRVGIDPNVQNSSLLADAIWGDNKDIAKLLINRSGNFNVQDNDGRAPLIVAANKGYKDLVQLLLSAGADPNVKYRACGIIIRNRTNPIKLMFGDTPLIAAARMGYTDIAEILLSAGADPNINNSKGKTALRIVSAGNHKEVVRLLLSQGALSIPDRFGDTPLIAASRKSHKDIVEILLNSGVDPNIKNNEGNTALMEAAKKRNKEIVKLLIEHSYNYPNAINLDIKNNVGHTALMIAARLKNREIIKLLLSSGADPNIKDNQGNTALIVSVNARGSKEVIRLLLAAGAKPNIRNDNDQSALSIAEQKNNYEPVLQMLKENIAAQALTSLS